MGYESITIDTVNYMSDQKNLMQQFIEYASKSEIVDEGNQC